MYELEERCAKRLKDLLLTGALRGKCTASMLRNSVRKKRGTIDGAPVDRARRYGRPRGSAQLVSPRKRSTSLHHGLQDRTGRTDSGRVRQRVTCATMIFSHPLSCFHLSLVYHLVALHANMPRPNFYDEVELEDMAYDEDRDLFHYPCPCGDRFEITRQQLKDAEDVAKCPSCSLIIRVVFDPVRMLPPVHCSSH